MKKKVPLLITVALILLSIIFSAAVTFNKHVTLYSQENVDVRMREITKSNMISFELQINEQIKKVHTLADYLGAAPTLGTEDQFLLLRSVVKNNPLLWCGIAFPDGQLINSTGDPAVNISETNFFKENMQGNFHITDPLNSGNSESEAVILFSSPIRKNGLVIGSLIYAFQPSAMDSIFNLDFLSSQGQSCVIKSTGQLLIGSLSYAQGESDVLQELRSRCTHPDHQPQECLVPDGNSGHFVLSSSNGEDNLWVNYNRLPFNDWYMLSVAPETSAASILNGIAVAQRDLTITTALCVTAYLILLFVIWRSEQNNIDKMTGALTTESFKKAARKTMKAHPNQSFVYVKLDIKNFKLINRVHSFAEGDRVIKNLAAALQYVLNDGISVFGRMGADDFILAIPYESREHLNGQRDAFLRRFRYLMGEEFPTSIEFPTGQYITTESDRQKLDISDFIEKANFAHRTAKQYNWTTIVDYVENLENKAIFIKTIEDQMDAALASGEFQMYLQPKYCIRTESFCSAEALIRWIKDGSAYMPPNDFIPVLESSGFIVKVDFYMFEQAVRQIRSWMDAGHRPVTISVNFSKVHLGNTHLVEDLSAIADRYAVAHHYLEIELTESTVFDNIHRITQLIDELHAAGFTLSLDDFGSGYSALSLLRELRVDVLKIDKGFFGDSSDQQRADVVISHIIYMAQELGIRTVAEGIEEASQVETLRRLGCDMIQGYYYGRPLPAKEFAIS